MAAAGPGLQPQLRAQAGGTTKGSGRNMGIFLWERSCELVAQGCASASVGGVLLLFLEVLPRRSWRQAQGTPCTARLQ